MPSNLFLVITLNITLLSRAKVTAALNFGFNASNVTPPEGTVPVLENNAHLSLSGQFSQELITLQHGFNKAC